MPALRLALTLYAFALRLTHGVKGAQESVYDCHCTTHKLRHSTPGNKTTRSGRAKGRPRTVNMQMMMMMRLVLLPTERPNNGDNLTGNRQTDKGRYPLLAHRPTERLNYKQICSNIAVHCARRQIIIALLCLVLSSTMVQLRDTVLDLSQSHTHTDYGHSFLEDKQRTPRRVDLNIAQTDRPGIEWYIWIRFQLNSDEWENVV